MADIENKLRRLVWISVAAAVVILLAAWCNAFPDPKTNGYLPDLVKLSFQFLVMVVIGGWVALLYKEYTHRRELIDTYKQELVEMSRELIGSYNETKRIRRLLRARAQRGGPVGDPDARVLSSVYDSLLGELNDVQLKLEAYKKRVRAERHIFDRVGDTLYRNIKNMEQYLGELVSEYEEAFRDFDTTPSSLPLDGLPRLKEFIATDTTDEDIRENVFRSFRRALDALAGS